MFPIIVEKLGARSEYLRLTGIFYIGSALAVLSAIVTFFFLPTLRPDNMVDEDRLFREYLVEHGVDITNMGIDGGNRSVETGVKNDTKGDNVKVVEVAEVEKS